MRAVNFQQTICALLIFVGQLGFSLPVQAAPEPDTPEAVAKVYLHARQGADWAAAVGHIAPDHIATLHPQAMTVFADEGKKNNILRKYFLGADVTAGSLRSVQKHALVGSYLELLGLLKGGRSGLTEFFGFKILNTFMENPEVANVVIRENARYMGMDYQTSSVLRLKQIGQRWYVLIDDEIFWTAVSTVQARQMHAGKKYHTVSIDLRPLTHDQRMGAFRTAARNMMSDRFVKYEIVVGTHVELSSELREIATIFDLHYRIQFVENSAVRPGLKS